MTVQRLLVVGVVTLAALARPNALAAEKFVVEGQQNFMTSFTGTIDAGSGDMEVKENRRHCIGTYRRAQRGGMLRCAPLSYSYELPDGIRPGGRVLVRDWLGGDFVLLIGNAVRIPTGTASADVSRKQTPPTSP